MVKPTSGNAPLPHLLVPVCCLFFSDRRRSPIPTGVGSLMECEQHYHPRIFPRVYSLNNGEYFQSDFPSRTRVHVVG